MGLKYDLTGQRFGRLVVLSRAMKDELPDKNLYSQVFWKCQCDCGNVKFVSSGHLRDGHTKSCGCLHDENARTVGKTHGMTHTRLHAIWSNMVQRCTNPKNTKYKDYGARGIHVCSEWRDFAVFCEWAYNNGYQQDLTIDRIDVDGNYCPENCRWATNFEQMRNMTVNHWITYKGETHILADWVKILGDKGPSFKSRILRGWSAEKAMETPCLRIRKTKRIEVDNEKQAN